MIIPRHSIGFFDSGSGGLTILRSVKKLLPQYDYLYFADNQSAPFGNKSPEEIQKIALHGVHHLVKEGAKLIIFACNTASADALPYIQQQILPKFHEQIRVLGVIVPTVEFIIALNQQRVGLLATQHTIESGAYKREFQKRKISIEIIEASSKNLAYFIDNNKKTRARDELKNHIDTFIKKNITTIVLACTHYGILKEEIRHDVDNNVNIVSQDDIIPARLYDYLLRHSEIEKQLSKTSSMKFMLALNSPSIHRRILAWFPKHASNSHIIDTHRSKHPDLY